MKKLLLMLMATVLLLCGAAMAEEPFTFREGLQWGMSPDEVQAAEGQEFTESYEFGSRMSMAIIDDGEHLGVEMDLRYLFVDGQLCCLAVDTTMVDQTACLPATAREVAIPGGNHAQFGSYGAQEGDGTATISAHAQLNATADALLPLLTEK